VSIDGILVSKPPWPVIPDQLNTGKKSAVVNGGR
jgi:hypothetical protein